MKVFPPFRLDVVNQSLWRVSDAGEEERVVLTPKQFSLLVYLVENAGRLVTQTELLDAVWSGSVVEPQAVKKSVFALRSALGDSPKHSRYIETVPRRGYRFIAPIGSLSGNPGPVLGTSAIGRLVGREDALEELQESWRLASNGEKKIVFVTGEAGSGKTALAEEFLHRVAAEPRARIATGQCIEGYGSKEPYGPMLDALGRLCRGSQSGAIVQTLLEEAPTWLTQLPGILPPERRSRLAHELLGSTRERMLREISEALDSITATTPLLVVF